MRGATAHDVVTWAEVPSHHCWMLVTLAGDAHDFDDDAAIAAQRRRIGFISPLMML